MLFEQKSRKNIPTLQSIKDGEDCQIVNRQFVKYSPFLLHSSNISPCIWYKGDFFVSLRRKIRIKYASELPYHQAAPTCHCSRERTPSAPLRGALRLCLVSVSHQQCTAALYGTRLQSLVGHRCLLAADGRPSRRLARVVGRLVYPILLLS